MFDVSYPLDSGVTGANSSSFEVKGRPLSLKITEQPWLVPVGDNITVSAELWDDALNATAVGAPISTYSWECNIELHASSTTGVLTGTTSGQISTGGNKISFPGLNVSPVGQDYILSIMCFSSEAEQSPEALTTRFHVHPFPDLGLLRKTSTAFKYHGTIAAVRSILDAFDPSMGTATCIGCPDGAGPGGSRKRRDTSSNTYLDYDCCSSPLSSDNDGVCQC
jgi:hypothetical protein